MKSVSFIISCMLFAASCKHEAGPVRIFQKLDPKVSGINFSNRIIETDSLNILDYLYFYNGGGVAAADFNNDGLEDLYFISNQSSNKLYLNKGNLEFEDITEKAGVAGTGSWKTGVTIVDINNDGFKDIYVSVVSGYKGFTGKNQLYINNGDLTFTEAAEEWGIDFEGFATQAAFFDYDKDGDLDLFILTQSVHNNSSYGDSSLRSKYNHAAGDHLFRNDDGHFTDVTLNAGIYASAIGYGLGVAVGDFNNDGWDDIYVSNDFFEQDYYYINQRNGTFREMVKDAFGHTSLFSMGNAVSDINKDGHLDILSTDMLPEDIKALKSTVNDQPPDVYDLQIKSGYHYQYSRNCLQLNVANGEKFIDIGLYAGIAATDWTWSPIIQDFDMDGKKDVFFSNGIKRRLTDLDYLKYLAVPNVVKTGADRAFDRDKIDRMPDGRVHNYLYRQDSRLKFKDISAFNHMVDVSCSSGAVAVDLDNDGDMEIVTNNLDEPASIYKNITLETSRKQKPYFLRYAVKFTDKNRGGIGTRFFMKSKHGVDHQEIQTSNAFQSNQTGNLLFTFSPDDQALELLVIWPDNSYQEIREFTPGSKQVLNFESDQVKKSADIAAVIQSFIKDRQHFDSQFMETKLLAELKIHTTPDFNYNSLLPHGYSARTPAIAVADINNDGLDDIYVGGIAGEEKYLLIANADGTYKKVGVAIFEDFKTYADAQAEWHDLDNDGNLDLIVQSANHPFADTNNIMPPRLYLNKGNFRFEYVPFPRVNSLTSKFLLADFDGDGLEDLFLAGAVSYRNYTDTLPSFLFLNKGSGEFVKAPQNMFAELAEIPFIRDMEAADINNDGKTDIVIAAEWQPIRIFINEGKQFKKWIPTLLEDLRGWWQSVKIADIDGDGKVDLLAGNWGLNNKYNVTPKTPLLAYNRDFDRNGRKDLLLSYSHQGKYYPFRQKSDLDQEIPSLKKEWLSYRKMAEKSTGEIFGETLNAPELSANYFKSIFISDIQNAREIIELPYLFQQAPLRSFALNDKDRNEVLANGNFSEVIPYEGKYDAVGLTSLQYDKVKNVFLQPRFWLNPQFHFRDIAFFQPLRVAPQTSGWLVLTAGGKLLLLSESEKTK